MKSFQEIAILEALKILKKASDKKLDNRQSILKDIANSDIETGVEDDENYVGELKGIKVIKSTHSQEVRDGELKARDNNVKDSTIIKALKKAEKKGFKSGGPVTLITYKNKQKKYDMIVAKWTRKSIVIITMIQDSKNNPKEYFTPKHQKSGEGLITTESLQLIDDVIVVDIED